LHLHFLTSKNNQKKEICPNPKKRAQPALLITAVEW
jgi:hypothetical protein